MDYCATGFLICPPGVGVPSSPSLTDASYGPDFLHQGDRVALVTGRKEH